MSQAVMEWETIASLFLEHFRKASDLIIRKELSFVLDEELYMEWDCPLGFENLVYAAGATSDSLDLLPLVGDVEEFQRKLLVDGTLMGHQVKKQPQASCPTDVPQRLAR